MLVKLVSYLIEVVDNITVTMFQSITLLLDVLFLTPFSCAYIYIYVNWNYMYIDNHNYKNYVRIFNIYDVGCIGLRFETE